MSIATDPIAQAAEPIASIETDDLQPLLERMAGARLVLIGEASHGTSEFYRMRQRITRDLIEARRADFVAVEGDWPDVARLDAWVRGRVPDDVPTTAAFARFPSWMWRNTDVLDFVDWLRDHNARRRERGEAQVAMYGLDLYSLYSSIEAVLSYLDRVDPEAAEAARERYGCLSPFQEDPALYGFASMSDRLASCEDDVVATLVELRQSRGEYLDGTAESFLDAEQNARIAVNAERYYRSMYQAGEASWNLRDTHMFETLEALLAFHGGDRSRGVIWAHNSHVGDARATGMADRGELNIGQLARERFGREAYLIGFGTHTGTVLASRNWGGPAAVRDVQPSRPDSHERRLHNTRVPAFTLRMREEHAAPAAREGMLEERLERAIGVIYRPETELASHYFTARMAEQFDEVIWFDVSQALQPLGDAQLPPEGHPLATLDV